MNCQKNIIKSEIKSAVLLKKDLIVNRYDGKYLKAKIKSH